MQSIECYHFQWSWLALDWDLKVVIFFDIENLKNNSRQSHARYRMVMLVKSGMMIPDTLNIMVNLYTCSSLEHCYAPAP